MADTPSWRDDLDNLLATAGEAQWVEEANERLTNLIEDAGSAVFIHRQAIMALQDENKELSSKLNHTAVERDLARKERDRLSEAWTNDTKALEAEITDLRSRLDEALKKLHELELIEKAHHEAIDETDFFAVRCKELEGDNAAIAKLHQSALEACEQLGRSNNDIRSRLDSVLQHVTTARQYLNPSSYYAFGSSDRAERAYNELGHALKENVVERQPPKEPCDHILRDTSEPDERRFIGRRCILDAGHNCDHVWSRD